MNESHTYPSVTIKKIKFKNHEYSFNFNEDDIVLFVGANNVGKSRTLKDIREQMIDLNVKKVLIDDIEFAEHLFTYENMMDFLENNLSKDEYGNYCFCVNDYMTHNYSPSTITQDIFNSLNRFTDYYKLFYTFLSTENRLNLTKPVVYTSNYDSQARIVINKLRTSQEMILKLNTYLGNCFKKGVDIDDTNMDITPQISYKIGEFAEIERLMHCERRQVYENLKKLDNLHDQGDGIRNAVAILASLIVNENRLYLIDEPETFLHPPQARQLGRDIVSLSTDKQCFIATHNIDFIRGVLENGSSRVKIIKIDRNGSENKYNCLDNESVRKISNDKNLKYSNILNGLFYKHVILCEDESDCKFYSAILEVVDTETYQNTLFCAVGGKGQFSKIVPLLNSLHINWYIIADLDLLNSTETVKYLLDSIGENKYKEIEDEHRDFLRLFQEGTNSEIKKQKVIKNEIEKIFKTAKDDEFISKETASKISSLLKGINSYHLLKTGGISNIPSGECVRCYEKVRDYLNENHIFLLECGEIEGLVKTIGGHGSHWVEKVFESYPDMNDQVYNQAKNFMRFVIDKLNR